VIFNIGESTKLSGSMNVKQFCNIDGMMHIWSSLFHSTYSRIHI